MNRWTSTPIPATILREIVEAAIVQHIDARTYELTRQVERSERHLLTRIAGGGR